MYEKEKMKIYETAAELGRNNYIRSYIFVILMNLGILFILLFIIGLFLGFFNFSFGYNILAYWIIIILYWIVHNSITSRNVASTIIKKLNRKKIKGDKDALTALNIMRNDFNEDDFKKCAVLKIDHKARQNFYEEYLNKY